MRVCSQRGVPTQISLQLTNEFAVEIALELKPNLFPIVTQVSPATEMYVVIQGGAGVVDVVVLVVVVVVVWEVVVVVAVLE